MRDVLRASLLNDYLKRGFESEEDLDFYIQEFLGYTVPKKKFCPEHVSPWRFLTDVYFERVGFALAFGSRSSGKTFITALIDHLNMLFRGTPVAILRASSELHQTYLAYQHLLGFFDDPLLGELVDGQPIQSRMKTVNGSNLSIVAGTMKGLNGPHTQKLDFDEIELTDWPIVQESFSIPISKPGIRSQVVFASTRKKSTGTMQRLLDEAEQTQMAIFPFCVWEVLEKCTRKCEGDPEWGNCPIFDKCKGRAHDCDGWYSINDLIAKVVTMSTSTFETQWENKSPSGGPKVYGEHFDERVHVLSWIEGGRFRSFKSIFGVSDIPKDWRKIGGMDFGAHFYSCFIAIEPRYDIWIVYFEYYYNQDRLLDRHAAEVKKAPFFHKGIRVYSDPSAKQEILEMRQRSINCVPAMNDLMSGVDEVKSRLEINRANDYPRLFIMDSCVEMRREMREWEHGVLPDGKPDLESFEDGNDHGLDSLRYPIFTYPRVPKPHHRYATVEGI